MIYTKTKYNNIRPSNKKNYLYEINSKHALTTNKEPIDYSKISDIYKYTYEDYFPTILTFNNKELFENEIEKIALNFLNNNFTAQELRSSFIKISIKKIKEELYNKINKDYSFLNESLNYLKKYPQKISYLSHFRKHCNKTDSIASHLCNDGKIGKFIEIKSKFSYKKIL